MQATSNAEYTSEAPIAPLSRRIACAAHAALMSERDFQRFQSEHTLACPRADERPRHFLNYGVKADSSAYWC